MRDPHQGRLASDPKAARVAGFTWQQLPPLPPAPGQKTQPGLAGPFAGTHRGALLVGGGTNFPARPPWENGEKVWWPDVFVLERRSEGRVGWVNHTYRLPRPLAHGMSFSTPDGVICVGGCDAVRCYPDVYRLAWDGNSRNVITTPLPPLPTPLAYMTGAQIGDQLFVAGGQAAVKEASASGFFYVLDLAAEKHPGRFHWRPLPSWPGPARLLAVAAASGGKFLLFGGRTPVAGRVTQILTDAYAFNLATETWATLGEIGVGERRTPLSIMAGAAAEAGDEILVFGGDRGELFLQLESYDLEIASRRRQLATAEPAAARALEHEVVDRLRAKKQIYESHPGFAREVLAYDPGTDLWRVAAESPGCGQAVTIAVPWDGGIVLPNGEVRPGTRTAAVTWVVPRLAG